MSIPRARALETLTLILCLWCLGRISSRFWVDRPPALAPSPHEVSPRQSTLPKVQLATDACLRRNLAAHHELQAPDQNVPPPLHKVRLEERELLTGALLTPTPWALSRRDFQIPLAENAAAAPIASSKEQTVRQTKTPLMMGSLWLLARAAPDAPASATRGELGGSQIGARLRLPLTGQKFALHLRASSNLDFSRGKEVGFGLSLQPFRADIGEIIVEQRLGLDPQGRTAPALILATGLNDTFISGRVIAEGYAQIGGIGLPKPDGFADGRLSLTTAIKPRLRLGGGIWGGAQQNASRVDIGPTLILIAGQWRATADWRLRIAGQAQPASGPSITLGHNF